MACLFTWCFGSHSWVLGDVGQDDTEQVLVTLSILYPDDLCHLLQNMA